MLILWLFCDEPIRDRFLLKDLDSVLLTPVGREEESSFFEANAALTENRKGSVMWTLRFVSSTLHGPRGLKNTLFSVVL